MKLLQLWTQLLHVKTVSKCKFISTNWVLINPDSSQRLVHVNFSLQKGYLTWTSNNPTLSERTNQPHSAAGNGCLTPKCTLSNRLYVFSKCVKTLQIVISICAQNFSYRCNLHLHLSLSENCRLALWEVDRGGRYSHRCARLDWHSLGSSLWLTMRLYLWVRSDHHGLLLVISERQGPPTPGRWMILLPVISIPAAVRITTTWGKK